MPVYLLHGFRWPRAGFTGIRVHIVMHNLEDCSAEYIQNAHSRAELLKSFRSDWPDIMNELESAGGKGLTFLEQYDPDDESSENAVSQPWAFVGDRVVTLAAGGASRNVGGTDVAASGSEPTTPKSPMAAEKRRASREDTMASPNVPKGAALSLNIEDVIAEGPGSTAKAWEAMADLRDKIAQGEKIGWWVVYNGDPDRAVDEDDQDEDDLEEEDEEETIPEQVELVQEDQTANRKTFVPAAEALKPSISSPPVLMSDRPKPNSKDMPPPERPPPKDKGKRTPGMKAPPQPDKMLPPDPPRMKPAAKPEISLKRRLFGKKS